MTEEWGTLHEILRAAPDVSPVDTAWRLWQRLQASALTPQIDVAGLGLFAQSVRDEDTCAALVVRMARDPLLSLEAVAACALYFPARREPNACIVVGYALWWCSAPAAAVRVLAAVIDAFPENATAQIVLTLISSGADPIEAREIMATNPTNS